MTYWRKATPLSWGIGMAKGDSPIYGDHRCHISVWDEGAGPYLRVEFFNEEKVGPDETEHMGFFFDHADIDAFAAHLHAALNALNEEPDALL
jgi:hypothetical protein